MSGASSEDGDMASGESPQSAGPPNRLSVKIVLDITLYAEDPDRQLAEGFAEALFEHFTEGPDDLDTFDYSVDGWDIGGPTDG